MLNKSIIMRQFGLVPYEDILSKMHVFTQNRSLNTFDEVWFVEHPCVFTKGQSCKDEYISCGDIPVIQSDRGGKITYHGPGQQIMYVMLDLKRIKINVRELVTILENIVMKTLLYFKIKSHLLQNAPGVYVNNNKICSLGLRVHRGCSFHGLALNVNMDLEPFSRIKPCGYSNLKMTQVNVLNPKISLNDIQSVLIRFFCEKLDVVLNV
ncbi:Octanoyltransferase [Candidatus Providencia siddallii]|uniref:Octanoyltransferase n=1 Tax=Candidatus Providencia siddallii TaxID=1715285 RepID=A0A0M6W7Y7_9GAMM|nr:Octanoyltransferase [Candidatus Providencia siddallii]